MSTFLNPLDFFPTFYNMQSVSSNAVAQALTDYATKSQVGYYNSASWYPSASVQTAIRNSFNNVANYTAFSGQTMLGEEGYWLGYKHTTFGSGIFISRGLVSGWYLDANSFTTRIIYTI